MTWSLSCCAAVSDTTWLGAMILTRSDINRLAEIGVLSPILIEAVDCQYSGLNAFAIMVIYEVFRPLTPGFKRLLASVPRTLSVGSTSCWPSGMLVSSLRPILGK